MVGALHAGVLKGLGQMLCWEMIGQIYGPESFREVGGLRSAFDPKTGRFQEAQSLRLEQWWSGQDILQSQRYSNLSCDSMAHLLLGIP